MGKHAWPLFAILWSTMTGCYYDKEEELYPFASCDTSAVTWSGTISPMLLTNCAISGCHVAGGTGPGDLTAYTNVKTAVDNGRLRQEVVVRRTMPPSGSMSPCDREKIDTWIKNGAPEN